MTTAFEVSQIQTSLSDARSRELNALVIYRKAVSAYHSAIADILDWKGVKIEGMPEMAPPPTRRSAPTSIRAADPGRERRAVMPEGRAAPPPAANPGPDSAFGRLVGVFVSPVRTFAAIARKPTWLASVASCGPRCRSSSGSSSSTRMDWRKTIRDSAAQRGQTTDRRADRPGRRAVARALPGSSRRFAAA